MRTKRFFTSLFLIFSLVFLNTNVVFAADDCPTPGVCGAGTAANPCAVGILCVTSANGNRCSSDLTQNQNACGPHACNAANTGVHNQCGGSGVNCPSDQRCSPDTGFGTGWSCQVPVAPQLPCNPGGGNCSAASSTCGSNGCAINQLCKAQGSQFNCEDQPSNICNQCNQLDVHACNPPTSVCALDSSVGHYTCQTAIPISNPFTLPSLNVRALDLGTLLGLFYSMSLPIGIVFGGFFIIRAGYMLKISEGNPQKVKEAQDALTAAVLGTLFVLLSAVILRVIIKTILGVNTPGF